MEPCEFDDDEGSDGPLECGNISVPLDYTDPDSEDKFIHELFRSRAINSPSKGSVLLNFGGPGYDGVNNIRFDAAGLHNYTGGYHDLILFIPRGNGKTMLFSCFDTQDERNAFWKPHYGFTVSATSWDEFDVDIAWKRAREQSFSNQCRNRNERNRMGELIGTTFVARDMMQIVDALAEDGLLRFLGCSYGSVISVTAAALFPEQIDRMVLDGVVNAFNYYNTHAIDGNSALSADAAYDAMAAILAECIMAGLPACPLTYLFSRHASYGNLTLSDKVRVIQEKVEMPSQKLHRTPIVVDTTIISSPEVHLLRDTLIRQSYVTNYELASSILILLLDEEEPLPWVVGTIKELQRRLSSRAENGHEAYHGILCGDKSGPSAAAETIEEVKAMAWQLIGVTRVWVFEEGSGFAYCAKWPFRSKEKFDTSILLHQGGIKTRHPILFTGPTYDPTTAIQNARNMSTYFANIRVLEVKDFGHCTGRHESKCMKEATNKYFVEGTLPASGTVCGIDEPLFKAPEYVTESMLASPFHRNSTSAGTAGARSQDGMVLGT